MSRTIKTMLIGALALLVMGAVTSSAQAEGEWRIEGKTLSELGLKEETVSVSGGPLSIILPSFGGLVIRCEKVEGAEGKIKSGGGSQLTMKLTTCSVLEAPACKVSEPLTLSTKSSVLSVGAYDKFEAAEEGKPIATITIKGEECALAPSKTLTGNVAAEVPFTEAVKQSLKFSETITNQANELIESEKEKLKLLYSSKTAFLSGEIALALSGANKGKVLAQDVPRPVRLCKTNGFPFCPPAFTYGIGAVLEATLETGTESEFMVDITEGGNTSTQTTKCSVSTFKAQTTSFDTTPFLQSSVSVLSFPTCAAPCSVTSSFVPYEGRIRATGVGNGSGTITLESGGTGSPRLKVTCTGAYKCTYESPAVSLTVPGGMTAPAKLTVNTTLNTKVEGGESDAKCGASLKWVASYKFIKPENAGVPKMWIVQQGVST